MTDLKDSMENLVDSINMELMGLTGQARLNALTAIAQRNLKAATTEQERLFWRSFMPSPATRKELLK